MKELKLTLPDGSVKVVSQGTTPQAVAASIGKNLERMAVAARVDGVDWDLTRPLPGDCRLEIITRDKTDALEVLRHSTAHLLAHAIKELYPNAQITIGPVIEDGFYYDIDCDKKLAIEDLAAVESRMEQIAARKLEVHRDEWPREKAIAFFKSQAEHYKAEIIEGLAENTVSVYTQGDFTDLCRGPHVPNTDRLGKFKLLSVAGAYWRGSEKNKMLQRIYGTAFATQKELDAHLARLEAARQRDHRKLGPELELFNFLPIAPAMPFYLPKGAQLFNSLVDYMRRVMRQSGYQEVICPQLMTTALWETSGHLEHFEQSMYFCDTGAEGESVVALKPMNCPGHASLFKAQHHSYRELPLRYSEFTKLHRYERAGVTHGLLRTRAFSQDDAHIFCTPDQIETEATQVIRDTVAVYTQFGFDDVQVRLATRPQSYLGTEQLWQTATQNLERALEAAGKPFDYAQGEGAFYGPKIEFHIKDSLGRLWQCGTIQLDYFMPQRFGLEYIDSDGQAKQPVMIHRAILGSVERFMGILIEHHAGHLPPWIAPVQAVVLNVATDQQAYAQELNQALCGWGIRALADTRNEKLGYRIREAQIKKIPWMVVVGPKEAQDRTATLRLNSGESLPPFDWEALHRYLEPLQGPSSTDTGGTSH